ncbi:MAG: CHAD domain-containing protein [Chloroflexaceae bacterium]|nr:CHAD domain-containing protein [Chloroflexaceae bacterium]
MPDVKELLDTYRVDVAHARQVADLALALFDAVAERYELLPAQRRLLEIGALLHNVGMTTDPPEHHLVGRDIVFYQEIGDLSPRERAVVACMVAFHRKKVRPELEPAYLALGRRGQRDALRLSAILRVADGLDYSQSQTTRLLAVAPASDGLTLILSGPYAAEDGARAIAKADLWRKVFGEPLQVQVEGAEAAASPALASPDGPAAGEVEEAETTVTPAPGTPDGPVVDEAEEVAVPGRWYADPEAPLAELGRVLLRRHLRRLRLAEREVRADAPIESVHDLRVATRRLRATLRLLTPVFAPGGLRAYTRGLGRLAGVAGPVRDRDVLLADLAERAPALPEEVQPAVAALSERLREERDKAFTALIAFLESDVCAEFLREFATLMNESEGWDDRPRVCDLAGSTIWRHYEILRAHDRGGLPEDAEELHAMRIDGKRLRYVLEFFAETLGQQADEVIKPLMAFQDHLGVLNDISVARHLLAPHADDPQAGAAVAAYLALREQQAAQLGADLPARWEKLTGLDYRRDLAACLVGLW